MEAVEIMIYLGVAMLIGGMIFLFVAKTDYGGFYENLRGEKEKQEFRKVTSEGFVLEAVAFWESCGQGSVSRNQSIMIEGSGQMNNTIFTERLLKLNYCNTLQIATEGCGNKDQLELTPFDLPRVVRMECDPVTRTLRIG
jgi:hypothetical protein